MIRFELKLAALHAALHGLDLLDADTSSMLAENIENILERLRDMVIFLRCGVDLPSSFSKMNRPSQRYRLFRG